MGKEVHEASGFTRRADHLTQQVAHCFTRNQWPCRGTQSNHPGLGHLVGQLTELINDSSFPVWGSSVGTYFTTSSSAFQPFYGDNGWLGWNLSYHNFAAKYDWPFSHQSSPIVTINEPWPLIPALACVRPN